MLNGRLAAMVLTLWLALLFCGSVSARKRQPHLTVRPTEEVKGHRGAEMILNCGWENHTGVLRLWHTPFGDLQAGGNHGNLGPVHLHQEGTLLIRNATDLHGGLYYCLLQDREAMTLWPYQLQIDNADQMTRSGVELPSSTGGLLLRWDGRAPRSVVGPLGIRGVGAEEEGEDREMEEAAGGSDAQFAAAVAASVVLTFVVGFSAGALSRAHVLRCLGVAAGKFRSVRRQGGQAEDRGGAGEVRMSGLQDTDVYENPSCSLESEYSEIMETTSSTTASSPPAKPQRSFRQKHEEETETATYLEGCDPVREKERGVEAKRGGLAEETKTMGEDESGEEVRKSEDGEVEEEESREATQTGEEEVESGEGVKSGGEEEGGEGEEGRREREERESDEEDEGETAGTASSKQDEGESASSASTPPVPPRRSRVIRLYQYDEQGQRYPHLPSPAPDETGPAPRLKQRSLSLTRLNAIMAAASAGPMDPSGEERAAQATFHMEI